MKIEKSSTEADFTTPIDGDGDPRKARSRAHLLRAATSLLTAGGIEAVTIEAVTRISKVARTTLYRHFDSAAHLRATALQALLPPVVEARDSGNLRTRLIDLITRQAAVINDAPINVMAMAWLATAEHADYRADPAFTSLRERIIEQYRRPLDEVLDSLEMREPVGERERALALAQLVGPIVFQRLLGGEPVTEADCIRLVDDFLTARTARE
ncbi:TetR/AcrR family transcriptional regulator [Nocardia sp. NPDC057668]|uniref:TetR/AcrR family transcriptional regulator n=1 Tax=Nocardia sp. NPDC057668 TaxID=3346202 RepID=UPI0036705E0E